MMEKKFVLVACEESQRVCAEFRKLGFIAFSCDIEPESGGHPEWHIQQNVILLLNGYCSFETRVGTAYILQRKWDLIIAHPPCTYLTVSGNRWFNVDRYGEKAINRKQLQEKGIQFFMQFINADCEHIAVENPIGVMSTVYRKADQIIQPFQFGHPYTKSTCLWLKNLPKLKPTKILEKPSSGWVNQCITPDGRYGGSRHSTEQRSVPKHFRELPKQWLLNGQKY